MLRVSTFKDENSEFFGKTYHYFEANGKEQVIIAFLSKRESEESSWLDAGTLNGSLKGEVDSFAEMFEDEFGYTLAETKQNGQKILMVAPIEEVLKGGKVNWVDLNNLDSFMMRRVFRTENYSLYKRYRILNPDSKSYENHIQDACTRDGVLQWINVLTGEVVSNAGCPGKEWFNYYCEIVKRRTDNPEPFYCFGDKELTEKFIKFCQGNNISVDQNDTNNTKDENSDNEGEPKIVRRKKVSENANE